MQRLISIFLLITLVSCQAKKIAVLPEIFTTYSPELNEINNAEIGISLASKEKGFTYDAIEIKKEFEIKLDYQNETIEVGQIFKNEYSTIKYDLYCSSTNMKFGIAIPKNGENALIYTTEDNDGIYTTGFSDFGINFIIPEEELKYVKTKEIVKKKDFFKQEFIFNGRVGNALKFIYREYVNDYARPAFRQDLQYDLSESKTIGFRGLRIQIINASNTKIEYKVLDYFQK
ncbi:MAG: hypothetical protein CMC55_00830 [Flavobacteriaceae bacterium]|nr:hypothetical protein [Flavobacteriaceae bacterium]|tara:strand:- start:275 stop:964 length:690 start_codon:yes stop_codon:yes gene_type:complete